MLTKKEWSTVSYSNINSDSNSIYKKDNNRYFESVNEHISEKRQHELLVEFSEIANVTPDSILNICAHRICGSFYIHEDENYTKMVGAKYCVMVTETFIGEQIIKQKYCGDDNLINHSADFIYTPVGKHTLSVETIGTGMKVIKFNPKKLHGILNNGIILCYVGWIK